MDKRLPSYLANFVQQEVRGESESVKKEHYYL